MKKRKKRKRWKRKKRKKSTNKTEQVNKAEKDKKDKAQVYRYIIRKEDALTTLPQRTTSPTTASLE